MCVWGVWGGGTWVIMMRCGVVVVRCEKAPLSKPCRVQPLLMCHMSLSLTRPHLLTPTHIHPYTPPVHPLQLHTTTHTGKTLVYALPLICIALQDELMMPLEGGEGPLGLIICPSRELANQTVEVITQFTDALKLVRCWDGSEGGRE